MEPVRFIFWEGLGFLLLLAGLAAYEAPRRRAWWRSLLREPEQVQLLVVTLVVSAKFVVDLAMDPSGAMPGIGTGWLVLFGVSSGAYGAGKGLRMMGKR